MCLLHHVFIVLHAHEPRGLNIKYILLDGRKDLLLGWFSYMQYNVMVTSG